MVSKSGSLQSGLDRDIYNFILKLESEKAGRVSAPSVYDRIKSSTSSLARLKRKLLEDSIDRVLPVRLQELKRKALDEMPPPLPSEKPNVPASQSRPYSASPTNGHRLQNGEPKTKKRKTTEAPRRTDWSPPTGISLDDLGGVDDVLIQLRKPVLCPLVQPTFYEQVNYRRQASILLHGPSGCGKTALVHAIAAALGKPFIPLTATSIVSGTSGESEKNVREIFDEALRLAPCLLFLDDIDTIAAKRDGGHRAMDSRIVNEINMRLDQLRRDTTPGRRVVVIAASNSPDSIDLTVRRRFHQVEMAVPDERAREHILCAMTRNIALHVDVNFKSLAKMTPGYVGADLDNIVISAVSTSADKHLCARLDKELSRIPDDESRSPHRSQVAHMYFLAPQTAEADPSSNDVSSVTITQDDFIHAISTVRPSFKCEGFSSIPDVSWSNIGAMQDVRRQLAQRVVLPIRDPELYAQLGIKPAAGILLWGPPGCGKTLIAKAVAHEARANLICVKGPELLNKYVGESERAVRQLFSRARASRPCIVFIDELDGLVPARDMSHSEASIRVVNTFLTELDGVDDNSGIYIIGTTNRPDMVEPAMRRPGRLENSIYIGLPTPDDRVDILRTLYRRTTRAYAARSDGEPSDLPGPDLERIARDPRCDGFSGADLESLLTTASHACIERMRPALAAADGPRGAVVISPDDWEKALSEVKPSVQDAEKYEQMLVE